VDWACSWCGETINKYKILMKKRVRKQPSERPRMRWVMILTLIIMGMGDVWFVSRTRFYISSIERLDLLA
jgi:hypothetical protein